MSDSNARISVLYNNHCRRVAHQCVREIAGRVGECETYPGVRIELVMYEAAIKRYGFDRNDAAFIELIRNEPALWAWSDVATEIMQCIERYDDNLKNF